MYSLHKPHGGMEHRVIKMNNSAILSIRRLCANPMHSEASNQLNAFRNFPQTSKWENMEMDWVSVAQTLNAIYLMSKREGRLGGEEKQIICLCLFFSTKAISITSISFHSNSSLLSHSLDSRKKTDFCDWKLLFFCIENSFFSLVSYNEILGNSKLVNFPHLECNEVFSNRNFHSSFIIFSTALPMSGDFIGCFIPHLIATRFSWGYVPQSNRKWDGIWEITWNNRGMSAIIAQWIINRIDIWWSHDCWSKGILWGLFIVSWLVM